MRTNIYDELFYKAEFEREKSKFWYNKFVMWLLLKAQSLKFYWLTVHIDFVMFEYEQWTDINFNQLSCQATQLKLL
jgi:hypothetical protein